jgi:glucosamine-6-phosphate deaminase
MHLLWSDSNGFSSSASAVLVRTLSDKPALNVALPTGRTPVGLYADICAQAREGRLPLDRARWFNLDEYLGLAPDHPYSYARFLREHLLDRIDAAPDRVRLLRGDAADPQAECRDYDRAIAAAGGLDLAILGLGANGHIAFNEPGSDWAGTTHIVTLSDQTWEANAAGLGGSPGSPPDLPRRGLTMGIATLRAARRVLLLVSGESKRQAFAALQRGLPDRQWPVTSLLDHPDLVVVIDECLKSPNR